MRLLLLLSLLLFVAACRNERPPAPTPEQSDQLNEAENMLDEVGNEAAPRTR
jgi:hypothetical protein